MAMLTDVTERERVAEALRESERRANELANLLPEIVFETDMEGNFTYVNHRGFELVGYTSEDIDKGLNALQVFAPEDRPRVMENMAKVFAGEDVGNPEYTVLRKDGTTFRALTSGNPIVRDDKMCGLRGIVIDITEREQAEQALRESEERLKLIFNNASDVIVLVDLTGTIISINDRVTDICGFTSEEVLGRSFADFGAFDSEQLSELSAIFMECVSQQSAIMPRMTVRSKHKDGHEIILETRATTVTSPEGKLAGFLTMLTDATERERAAQALQESQERLQYIFDSASDIIVLTDPLGNILSINSSVKTIFGWSADEVTGRNFTEIGVLHPDDMSMVVNMFADAVSTGQVIQTCFEIKGLHRDGHEIPIEIASSAAIGRDSEGKVQGLLATIRDITERKRSEEELARVKKEKDAQLVQSAKLANLGEMATGIAHEINQPLNIIKLTCSGLDRSMKKGKTITSETLTEELETIDGQIERMRAIIDHMRSFARRSSDLKSEYTDMNAPLRDCFKFIGEQLRLREVEVHLELEELPQVMADSNKIEQVFLNLVGNARDAMDNLATSA